MPNDPAQEVFPEEELEVIEEPTLADIESAFKESVRTETFRLLVGNKVLNLTIRNLSYKAHSAFMHDFRVQTSGLGAAGASTAETWWIFEGVINPKTGARMFNSFKHAQQTIAEADAQSVQELIRAIQVLSGTAAPVDWDKHYESVRNVFVDGSLSRVRDTMTPYVAGDLEEPFENALAALEETLREMYEDVVSQAAAIAIQKYKGGPTEPKVTDEELGNE